MEAMFQTRIPTVFGDRSLGVYCQDITTIEEEMDILVISCFLGSYAPTRRTVIGALNENLQISVAAEATHPAIDLRDFGNVWLSEELDTHAPIKRIAAVEMSNYKTRVQENWTGSTDGVLPTIHTLFQMLELAASRGVKVDTIVLPILGSGNQRMDLEFIGIPLVNECIRFLEKCEYAGKICIVERSPEKAYRMARTLEESYRLKHMDTSGRSGSARERSNLTNYDPAMTADKRDIFLSYSTKDADSMHQLCDLLEKKGAKVWYAPRDIWGTDYASCIVDAIRNADYFVPLISQNSLKSRHVLNELDLAFNSLPSEQRILPIMLDHAALVPAFLYYLSRLQWYTVQDSPEEVFEQFSGRITGEILKIRGVEE